MSSKVSWQVEGKIILIQSSGILTVDDVVTQATQLAEMMDNAGCKVHLVDDLSRITGIEPTLALLPLRRPDLMKFAQHPNLDIIAIIGMTNSVASFAFELVRKFNKALSSQRFSSVDEAVAWLQEVDRIRTGEKTAAVS
jgi:hypothetical protein